MTKSIIFPNIDFLEIKENFLEALEAPDALEALEALENIAMMFNDSIAFGAYIVYLEDFHPNDGMFCFELMLRFPDGQIKNLNYDFDSYLEPQTFPVPGTDFVIKTDPILLKLYDE